MSEERPSSGKVVNLSLASGEKPRPTEAADRPKIMLASLLNINQIPSLPNEDTDLICAAYQGEGQGWKVKISTVKEASSNGWQSLDQFGYSELRQLLHRVRAEITGTASVFFPNLVDEPDRLECLTVVLAAITEELNSCIDFYSSRALEAFQRDASGE